MIITINEFKSNVTFGKHYDHYLDTNNYRTEKLPVSNAAYSHVYKITNNNNAQLFKGVLYILHDGRAFIKVSFVSYSGVKVDYINYFNNIGKEILTISNSDKLEKTYFDSLAD